MLDEDEADEQWLALATGPVPLGSASGPDRKGDAPTPDEDGEPDEACGAEVSGRGLEYYCFGGYTLFIFAQVFTSPCAALRH